MGMHIAAEKNMFKTLDQFMNCGGDPEIKNQLGFGCVHIAAREGHAEIIKLLKAKEMNSATTQHTGPIKSSMLKFSTFFQHLSKEQKKNIMNTLNRSMKCMASLEAARKRRRAKREAK